MNPEFAIMTMALNLVPYLLTTATEESIMTWLVLMCADAVFGLSRNRMPNPPSLCMPAPPPACFDKKKVHISAHIDA